VEWNFALMAPNSGQHYFSLPSGDALRRPLSESSEHHKVRDVLLADEHEGVVVRLNTNAAAKLWRAPIESISLSEGGFERVFQSCALLFSWELRLVPGAKWTCRFHAELSDQ
jgi:alpha-amylase